MENGGYTRMFVVNLANKVKEMRDAQRYYFKHRNHLELAKELESEVDMLLDDIIHPDTQHKLDL